MLTMGAVLAIACSFGWSTADVLRKRLAAGSEPLDLSIRLAGVQLVLTLSVAILVLVPVGVENWSTWRLTGGYWAYAVPGFLCTALGHVLFLKALKASDLSLTIPFLSFSPIFVMLVGVLVLNEWPSGLAFCGVLTVALGSVVLNAIGARKDNTGPADSRSQGYRKGLTLIIATAVSWSIAAALDKGAIQNSSQLTHLTLLLSATWVLLIAYRWCTPSVRSQASVSAGGGGTGGIALWVTCAVMVASLALQLAAYAYWDVAS